MNPRIGCPSDDSSGPWGSACVYLLLSVADLDASWIRHGEGLARGWTHVGAGGWSWLVEAEHRKRLPSLPEMRIARNKHP